jgi:DNA-binding NarL/FixJ family response regulator
MEGTVLRSAKAPARRARVLLADRHPVVIEGLRGILHRLEHRVVGVVHDGRALVRAALQRRPDAIITAIAIPLVNGIDATRQIHKQNRETKIICLTGHGETAYVSAAFAAGASGYVLKSDASEDLAKALGVVLAGRIYVSAALPGAVAIAGPAERDDGATAENPLTPRQREILQLLSEGRHVKEIAAALRISPRTVEFHKYRSMEAIGVNTFAEMVRYALECGIVT